MAYTFSNFLRVCIFNLDLCVCLRVPQASAVFDAKRKLASVKKAEEKAVSADDLIRFAHRISASGAVAAPPTWAPGQCHGLVGYLLPIVIDCVNECANHLIYYVVKI